MMIACVVFPRQAWQALGDMSQTTAMAEFVKQLDSLCPLFRPFTEAHNAEKQEQERKRYSTKSMSSDFQSLEKIRQQNIDVFHLSCPCSVHFVIWIFMQKSVFLQVRKRKFV